MIILGIETSCDETALCLLETTEDEHSKKTFRILANSVISQIDIHREYGGVFPMVAKREHAHNLVPLLHKLLEDAGTNLTYTPSELTAEARQTILTKILGEKEKDLLTSLTSANFLMKIPSIDMIAVTEGPGLEPALWVGINFAQVLGEVWNIPVHPVNHMEGHIVGSLLDSSDHDTHHILRTLMYPALAVLISGGHTELVLMNESEHTTGEPSYSLLGMTRDDAIGEAFDKVARMLGLAYPGGPEVGRLAAEARDLGLPRIASLPRPMIHSKDLDFSFSGIKTAVLYYIRDLTKTTNNTSVESTKDAPISTTHPQLPHDLIRQICREFEDAVTEVLITKTRKALEQHDPATLIIGGGVTANTTIRTAFESLATEYGIPLYLPVRDVSGDNALMIALAGALFPREASTTLKAQGTKSLHRGHIK